MLSEWRLMSTAVCAKSGHWHQVRLLQRYQPKTEVTHKLRCSPVQGGSGDVTSKFHGCRRPNVTTPGAGAAGKSGLPVRNAS